MLESGDTFSRDGEYVDLPQVIDALCSIDGVAFADARAMNGKVGIEVIGLLTVHPDSSLTPKTVMEYIRSGFPRQCWPDRVLMTYQAGPFNAVRRAA
jgi:hypothetical protein